MSNNAYGKGDIKAAIVEKRKSRIVSEGYTLGHPVPDTRNVPLIPFLEKPRVICEVKRKSPSKGAISMSLDPVEQAGRYVAGGIRSISVLTEEDHFAGSLSDLMSVKHAYPQTAVLRKDFLIDTEDIDVSFRAGADAVLLIASMLPADTLQKMYKHAVSLGMAVLFEIHDDDDIAKAAIVQPEIIGINCRDLSNFTTDLIYPLKVRGQLLRKGVSCSRLVFESGIFYKEDAAFAFSSGFSGILVGESVVRDPSLIPELVEASAEYGNDSALTTDNSLVAGFWGRLYSRRTIKQNGKPLVKICGITRLDDAEYAAELGVDILGFIFVPSTPRFTNAAFVRSVNEMLKNSFGPNRPLMAAVVVTGIDDATEGTAGNILELRQLIDEGIIDVIQFHGNEQPDECFMISFPYYKALRIGSEHDVSKIDGFRSPRVLVDAFSQTAYGGTGKQIDGVLLEQIKQKTPLWLAGGLNPENVSDIIQKYRPELIDASSGLESSPGVKSHEKLDAYFSAINLER